MAYAPSPTAETEEIMALALTSNSFKEGGTLALDQVLSKSFGFGTDGGNKSPQLSWSGAPAGTKSFALTCFDPDAPTGSGFWHWVVVNIPANVTELKLDAGNPKSGLLPQGALMTRTDLGQTGYLGPAPPPGHGPHRYIFTGFAVKEEKLGVEADTAAADIKGQISGALKVAFPDIIAAFEKETGNKVTVIYNPGGAIAKSIEDGKGADMAIMPSALMAKL